MTVASWRYPPTHPFALSALSATRARSAALIHSLQSTLHAPLCTFVRSLTEFRAYEKEVYIYRFHAISFHCVVACVVICPVPSWGSPVVLRGGPEVSKKVRTLHRGGKMVKRKCGVSSMRLCLTRMTQDRRRE